MLKTITYPAMEREEVGVLWFTFDSPNGELTEGVTGYGSIRYPEGSVYTGTLLYLNGTFNKYGYGEQDFTKSIINSASAGADPEYQLYKYVGYYDYTRTEWIYGNGIMYFTKNGVPAAYSKGFFSAVTRIGKWRGKFDKRLLLPEYASTNEIVLRSSPFDYDRIHNEAKQAKKAKTVLLGDSYLDYYAHHENPEFKGTFAEDTAGYSVIDLGIGGTKYCDWMPHIAQLNEECEFENVVINLGFNDIHSGISVNKVYKQMQEVVSRLRQGNSNVKIYIYAVTHSPNHVDQWKKEDSLNALVKAYCLSNGITFFDSDKKFVIDGKRCEGYDDMFVCDGIHLSKKGYAVWTPYLLGVVKGE